MIKHNIFAVLTLVPILLSSCASTKVDTVSLSPAAIISVKANGSLPWYEKVAGEETKANEGIIDNLINKNIFKTDPEIATAQDRVDYAEETIRFLLGDQIGLEVLEKEKLLDSKQYKRMHEDILSAANTTVLATGYKDVSSISKVDAAALKDEIGANSYIFAKFEFYKRVVSGNKVKGTIVPYVRMTVSIRNTLGKEVFYKKFTAQGTEEIRIRGRDYDKDALVDKYPPIIDMLISKLAVELL